MRPIEVNAYAARVAPNPDAIPCIISSDVVGSHFAFSAAEVDALHAAGSISENLRAFLVERFMHGKMRGVGLVELQSEDGA